MMTDTTEVERFEPYTDEGNREGYGQMELCEGGDWVRATDYDALAADIAESEGNGDLAHALHQLSQVKAKLADAERVARYETDIAQQALDQMRAAEAALPAVYRLALEDAAGAALGLGFGGFYDPIRKKAATAVIDLPTPTAEELMERIKEAGQ